MQYFVGSCMSRLAGGGMRERDGRRGLAAFVCLVRMPWAHHWLERGRGCTCGRCFPRVSSVRVDVASSIAPEADAGDAAAQSAGVKVDRRLKTAERSMFCPMSGWTPPL